MGINVRAGGGKVGAATALSAFVGGAGQRLNQIEDRQSAFAMQQIEQNRREHEIGMAETGFEQRSKLEADRFQRQKELEDYRVEMQQRGYSERQQQDMNKDWQAYGDAVKSGDYTPEQLSQIEKSIREKHMGIEPIPEIKKSPYPEGQGVNEMWTGDDNIKYTRNAKGEIKVVPGWKPPQAQQGLSTSDISDIYKSVRGDMELGLEEGKSIDPVELKRRVKEQVELIRELQGGDVAPVKKTGLDVYEIDTGTGSTVKKDENDPGARWRSN